MIWIAGGTSETRDFLRLFEDKSKFIISVTSQAGLEFLPEGLNCRLLRLNLEEMIDFIGQENINLIVDLTHPFAKEASGNLKEASSSKGIDYLRYLRPADVFSDFKNIIFADSYEEGVDILREIEGNVLFTTGVKRARDFIKVQKSNRFVFRVLPRYESIRELEDLGVGIKDRVAMVGPFTKEMNLALINYFEIDYMLAKESGQGGGLEEKIEACIEAGIRLILIRRKKEEGIESLNQLKDEVKKYL